MVEARSSTELDTETLNQRFLDAARFGDTDELKLLVGIGSAEGKGGDVLDVNCVDDQSGASALHMASANGHLDTLKFLLSMSGVQYKNNHSGNTALHWALQNGQWGAAKVILTSSVAGCVDVLQENAFRASVLAEAMNRQPKPPGDDDVAMNENGGNQDVCDAQPGSVEAMAIEVLRLILEHPSAGSLEQQGEQQPSDETGLTYDTEST